MFGNKIDPLINVSSDSHTINRAPDRKMNYPANGPEILIIDDESDICFLLSAILKQKELASVFASSLTEASEIMKCTKEFSFIFLDNHLPDGRGVDYIKQIKESFPSCKVIMITAHDNQTDREKASNEGADYFIGKPFTRELILNTIKDLSA